MITRIAKNIGKAHQSEAHIKGLIDYVIGRLPLNVASVHSMEAFAFVLVDQTFKLPETPLRGQRRCSDQESVGSGSRSVVLARYLELAEHNVWA